MPCVPCYIKCFVKCLVPPQRSSALEIKVLFQVPDISTHLCVLPLVPASNPASRGLRLEKRVCSMEIYPAQ